MEINESLLPSFNQLTELSCNFGACFFGVRQSRNSASGYVAVVGFALSGSARRFGHFIRGLLPASIPCVRVREAFGTSVTSGAQFVVSVPLDTASLPQRALAGPVWAAITYPCC